MTEEPRIGIITQARFGSTRLPGKVLREVSRWETLLDIHLERVAKTRQAHCFIVATTEEEESKDIMRIAEAHKFVSYQGSLHDVLDRYYQAALEQSLDVVVRVTSDCPLVDPTLIDILISKFLDGDFDYVSNIDPPSFVDGFDVEVFSFETLKRCWEEAKTPSLREHVTSYVIETDLFRRFNLVNERDESSLRLTVDTPDDFERVVNVIRKYGKNRDHLFYSRVIQEDSEI